MNHRLSLIACCTAVCVLVNQAYAQDDPPPPIPVFATNNSGFLQFGPGAADNLVLFIVPPIPGQTAADLATVTEFTIIGELSSNVDGDGDGLEDSVGTFAGLEWAGGAVGGVLVGSVLNREVFNDLDKVGNDVGTGEVYQIDPDTGDTVLIGSAPAGTSGFSDLAFNPQDGLMYGLMNDFIVDPDTGDIEYGNNTLWADTDGDLVPDSPFLVPEGPGIAVSYTHLTLPTKA